MKMRVYKWEPTARDDRATAFDYIGTFHQWSTDSQENNGICEVFPVAIVEKPDGFLEAVPVALCQVINKKRDLDTEIHEAREEVRRLSQVNCSSMMEEERKKFMDEYTDAVERLNDLRLTWKKEY